MIVRSVKFFVVVSGAWNIDWTEDSSLRIVQLWYRRVIQGIAFIFFLSITAKLIQLILINADAKVLYESASFVLTTLATAIKAFIYQKSSIYRMLQKMIDEEKRISMSLDDKMIKSYNKDVKMCTLLKNALVASLVFTAAVFFIFKTIIFFKNKGCKTEEEMLQEFYMYPIWLPYKESDSLISVIILNLVYLFAATNIYSAAQIMPVAFMIFVAAQIKILQVLIRNLDSIDSKNIDYNGGLKEIVRRHLFIIQYVNMLNSETKYVMLTNFLLYSINIASVAVEILMQNTLKEVAFPLAAMFHHVINVFLIGWFANEIKVQIMQTAYSYITVMTNFK